MRPVTIMDKPHFNPGECFKCKCNEMAEGREYFVDLGIDIEWVGVLFLCNICLADIIRVTPDILHKSIVDAAAEAQSNFISEAERKDQQYEDLVAGLNQLGIDLGTISVLTEARKTNGSMPDVEVDIKPLIRLELGR